jgi:hypothetical protein
MSVGGNFFTEAPACGFKKWMSLGRNFKTLSQMKNAGDKACGFIFASLSLSPLKK